MAKKSKVRFSKQQRWAIDELEDYLEERDSQQTARPSRRPRQAEFADRGDSRPLARSERQVPEWGLT